MSNDPWTPSPTAKAQAAWSESPATTAQAGAMLDQLLAAQTWEERGRILDQVVGNPMLAAGIGREIARRQRALADVDRFVDTATGTPEPPPF